MLPAKEVRYTPQDVHYLPSTILTLPTERYITSPSPLLHLLSPNEMLLITDTQEVCYHTILGEGKRKKNVGGWWGIL